MLTTSTWHVDFRGEETLPGSMKGDIVTLYGRILNSPSFTHQAPEVLWVRNHRIPIWHTHTGNNVIWRSLFDRPFWEMAFALRVDSFNRKYLRRDTPLIVRGAVDAFYEDFIQAKLAVL